jgi:hypothetical protein
MKKVCRWMNRPWAGEREMSEMEDVGRIGKLHIEYRAAKDRLAKASEDVSDDIREVAHVLFLIKSGLDCDIKVIPHDSLRHFSGDLADKIMTLEDETLTKTELESALASIGFPQPQRLTPPPPPPNVPFKKGL